jgi:hypothetical protein
MRPKALWRSRGVSLVRRSRAALSPWSRAVPVSLRLGRLARFLAVLAVSIVQTFYQVQIQARPSILIRRFILVRGRQLFQPQVHNNLFHVAFGPGNGRKS